MVRAKHTGTGGRLCPHSYLFWRFRLDEHFVDLLGLGRHFEGGFDFLVFLARQPELDVFVAEFRLEESPEGRQSI